MTTQDAPPPNGLYVVHCPRQDGSPRIFMAFETRADAEHSANLLRMVGAKGVVVIGPDDEPEARPE